MSLDFRKVLALPDKGISRTRDPLSRLFRKMLFDLGMDEFHANKRAREYLDDPSNRIPNNPSARSSARGNLFKELASDRMTFNVFIKGLKFLGPQAATFRIDVKWNASRTTTHLIEMPISPTYYARDAQPIKIEEIAKIDSLLTELRNTVDAIPSSGIIVKDKVALKHNGSRTSIHEDEPPTLVAVVKSRHSSGPVIPEVV
jgi:hypothetical protein